MPKLASEVADREARIAQLEALVACQHLDGTSIGSTTDGASSNPPVNEADDNAVAQKG